MSRPKHPFNETADLLDDLLRADREHERRGTGVVVFARGEAGAAAAREERDHLRHLASLDIEQGWPWEDGTPPLDLAA